MSITTDKSAMNNKPRARYGSGSIRYNTAKNAYVVSYRGKCTTVRTRKLAEEKLREFRAIMKNVSDNERKKAKERKANGNMTLAEMVELYLTNEYDCNDHKIRTSIRQYQTFALFKEQPIANVKLKDFVAIDIKNKLFIPMQTEKSYSTMKKVYELLRAAVRWASTPPQNLLAYDICAGKTIPAREKFTKDVEKIDKGIVKFYTAKQQQLIIQECDSRLKNGNLAFHYGPAIKLILHTGLRSGEALYLRWNDVDFINRTIFVNGTITEYTDPKTHKTVVKPQSSGKTASSKRIIRLNDDAYADLLDLKELNGNFEHVISTSEGMLCTPSNFRHKVDTIIKRVAKIDPTINLVESKVHALRHTYATVEIMRLMQSNNDNKPDNALLVVSKLLGHSSIEITNNTYLHLLDLYAKNNQIKII